MAEEERDINLENLFRHKLEGSEMVPGGDLTGQFMSRLERREFFRFNPARFNLYYLTVAAALTLAAGILIFSRSNELKQEPVTNDTLPQAEMTFAADKLPATDVTVTDGKTVAAGNTASAAVATVKRSSGGEPRSAVRNNVIKISGQPGDASLKVAGQAGENNITLRDHSIPVPVIETSETSGCVPLRVSFRNTTSGSFHALWSFGDGGTSAETETDYIYDLPGNYTVKLTLTDAKGHTSVTSTAVEVWPVPDAAFEIPETDVSITDGQVLFKNLSVGATQYLWDFGDEISSGLFEPSHRYDRYGKYDVTLIAFSENGCADSLTLADAFTDSGTYLRFPNVFVPNTGGPSGGYYSQRSDEANQVFHAVSSGVNSCNLKIYSKQGMLVFESDDLNMGWDGYYNGQLCSPGVYIWKARGSWRNGQSIVMSGDVTLLKY
ncbi:MAG TPA: PKD domain-containing protein [Bacteroidales bacterium]|nr:PKD domain-containing protein [Bacteroidales bacterium]